MGVLTIDATVVEINRAAMEAIPGPEAALIGQPFWLTPWFTGTPGMIDNVKGAVAAAADGQLVNVAHSP